MDYMTAIELAENGLGEDATEEQEATYIEAWQVLVNTGLAWRLQGWFGRTAAAMIEAGQITPKPYWKAE